MDSPRLSIVLYGVNTNIGFTGSNLQPGDSAKWVSADAPSCNAPYAAISEIKASPLGSSGIVSGGFTFGSATSNVSTGVYRLCYKFAYASQPVPRSSPSRVPPTVFLDFPEIRVAVVRYDSVEPRGTGVGCASNLTVRGAGFSNVWLDPTILNGAQAVRCSFGTAGFSTPATVVDDTTLRCQSTRPSSASNYPMRIDISTISAEVLTKSQFAHFPRFIAFDPTAYSVATLFPSGGAYNLEPDVVITGVFEDFGAPRCRFESVNNRQLAWVGLAGTVTNATHATCRKPRFPDTQREAVGFYEVAFSPNGQCFATSSANAQFGTYNTQVNSLSVRGAPSTSSVSLTIIGEGFVQPALPGGVCRFTQLATSTATTATTATASATSTTTASVSASTTTASAAVSTAKAINTALTTLSATQVRCETPADGTTSGWTVQVMQNGVTPEPALFRDPLFYEYDIASVRVSELEPPGGLTGQSTAVTVVGSGFRDLGADQLRCRVTDASATTALVPGLLLDEVDGAGTKVLCNVPPSYTLGFGSVTISLNNGTTGTFSADESPFTYYHAPYLRNIAPATGAAEGGLLVTVTGRGFTALAPTDASIRARFMRCRFGTAVQRQPPAYHTDTQVVCNTTWGVEGNQPVSVSLNAATFLHRATEGVVHSRQLVAKPLMSEAHNTADESEGTALAEATAVLDSTRRALSHTPPALAGATELPQFKYYGLHPPAMVTIRFS